MGIWRRRRPAAGDTGHQNIHCDDPIFSRPFLVPFLWFLHLPTEYKQEYIIEGRVSNSALSHTNTVYQVT